MGNLAPHADLPSMRTVPCGHPKTGYCLFWCISKPMHSRWCTGAYSAWSRAKPISGFTSSCPHCWRRCAPSATPPPARSRPSPSASASQRRTPPLSSSRKAREPHAAPAPPPSHRPHPPPFAHDGTERRIVRPQDPPQQAACYSGKKKDHTVKNVLLVNALLVILFLSDTHGGRVHDLRIAETTPYPLPAGSGLLQDLGFLSFTLPEVEILM